LKEEYQNDKNREALINMGAKIEVCFIYKKKMLINDFNYIRTY
jgi:hypothetical protein